jgi:hypothetical protein
MALSIYFVQLCGVYMWMDEGGECRTGEFLLVEAKKKPAAGQLLL